MHYPLCGHLRAHKHGKTSKGSNATSVENVGKPSATLSIRFTTVVKSVKKMCGLCCNLMQKVAVCGALVVLVVRAYDTVVSIVRAEARESTNGA